MAEGDAFGGEQGLDARVYWVCKSCPAADECSEQAFRRAKCWGWSLGECKKYVYKHLQISGKHQEMTKEDRQILTDNAEYEEFIDEHGDHEPSEVTLAEAAAPQPPKRPREPSTPPPGHVTTLWGQGQG